MQRDDILSHLIIRDQGGVRCNPTLLSHIGTSGLKAIGLKPTTPPHIVFYGSLDLKAAILPVIFPLVFAKALYPKLPVSTEHETCIPVEWSRTFFSTPAFTEQIRQQHMTTGWHFVNNTRRLYIVSARAEDAIDLLWNYIQQLEFVPLGHFVLHEESGEGICHNDSFRGTVAILQR